MLIIRDEQMEALRLAAMKSFEQRMVRHLNEHFPEECRRAGAERIRGAISQGVYRAGQYGIVSERDVARYIDLSVVLGLDFDSGKRYPWAKEILARKDNGPPQKLQALYEGALRTRAEKAASRAAAPATVGPPGRDADDDDVDGSSKTRIWNP